MSQTTLLFIGALATLATVGLFVDFADDWTGVVVAFGGSILWGIFGLSAYDITIYEGATVYSETDMALVAIGIGFGIMVGMYALAMLFSAFNTESSDVDTSLLNP